MKGRRTSFEIYWEMLVYCREARTFTNIINRSLVANFAPAPQLSCFVPHSNSLVLSWPTNFTGFVLQQNADLTTTNWSSVTNAPAIVGTNKQVTITPLTGRNFFRLLHP